MFVILTIQHIVDGRVHQSTRRGSYTMNAGVDKWALFEHVLAELFETNGWTPHEYSVVFWSAEEM